MNRTTLRGTEVETSRLGFGCGTLTLHDDPAAAVASLEAAFEAGVTHFDVARQYGFGQAEGILGRFLRGKRDKVTVATKFGLAPPAGLAKHRGLVSFARRLAHRSRGFGAVARKVLRRTARPAAYDAGEAARSLEISLRELGTDYVDVYLAHECSVDDAGRDELCNFLEDARRRGRVRAYGVAGAYENLRGDAALIPQGFRVLQFRDHAGLGHARALRNAADRAIVTFGPTAAAGALAAAARANPALAARHGAAVGADLSDVGEVAPLLIGAALADNPDGVMLFGTRTAEHLRANVRSAGRAWPAGALDAFAAFAREALASGEPSK